VAVEGQMTTPKRHVGVDQGSKAAHEAPRKGLEAVPEKAMVDHEDVGPACDGLDDRGLGCVDGGHHVLDGAATLDLETVQRAWIVWMPFYIKVFLQVLEQLF
jgi:hypothetical protein